MTDICDPHHPQYNEGFPLIGTLVIDNTTEWFANTSTLAITGRWVPVGADTEPVGGATVLVLHKGQEPKGPNENVLEPEPASFGHATYHRSAALPERLFPITAEDANWLHAITPEMSGHDLLLILPWAGWAIYRHPLYPDQDVVTIRSAFGGMWAQTGELHVTLNEAGRAATVELMMAFNTVEQLEQGASDAAAILGRGANELINAPFSVPAEPWDGYDCHERWWTKDGINLQMVVRRQRDVPVCTDEFYSVPHYITVRKVMQDHRPTGDMLSLGERNLATVQAVRADLDRLISDLSLDQNQLFRPDMKTPEHCPGVPSLQH